MSEPTQKDAELLIRLWENGNSPERRKAFYWAMELEEQSYEEFIKENPIGTDGWDNFILCAGYFEMVGILVKYGPINEDMVLDLHYLLWDKLGPLVKGFQKERGSPRFLENYEYLAKKKTEWAKTHPAGYKM
jgi:hypothetical protein